MTAVAAVVLVVELFAVPAMFGKPAGAVEAVLLMGGVVWATGLISVLPVMRSRGKGPFAVVQAFFLGMGLRVIVALAVLAWAVKARGLPAGPVAVSLMMMYLALLFVETRIVVGYVKTLDSRSKGGGTGTAAEAPKPAKPQAAKEDSSSANCVEVLA